MASALPPVLGCGAWLKNAACLLAGGQAHWSPVHGDLGDPQACRALDASLRRLARWPVLPVPTAAQARPESAVLPAPPVAPLTVPLAPSALPVAALAHDLHPDFFSTRIAQALAAEWGVPAIGVQHHHAHIGVVMAEHGVDEPVVGLALDGVGLGLDGTAWGGELLWVSLAECRRLGGLWPLALPGGDVAAREPWRMAAAALHALGRGEQIETRFAGAVGAVTARGVQRMLAAKLNCPPTSSMGRWFDAAAAALGLSVRQQHEAQAAVALEQEATRWLQGEGTAAHMMPAAQFIRQPPCCALRYSPLGRPGGLMAPPGLDRLDLRPLLQCLLDWPEPQQHAAEAAAWFHVQLAQALADWAAAAARETAARTVCLGGGCFYNAVLVHHMQQRLQAHGLRVLLPQASGCGDAGLALGQAWVAAHRLRLGRAADHGPTMAPQRADPPATRSAPQRSPIESESAPCA